MKEDKVINSMISYYNKQINYLDYIKYKILCVSPIFLIIMIFVSMYNKDLNFILMAFYIGYIISIIQDYNILHNIIDVFNRIKRRRYLYKKLKQKRKHKKG